MENTEYLTQEKFKELQKELEYLKKDKRKEIAEHLEYARSLGDLSENAEYHEARSEQANTEDRIARLENLLKTAQIVSGKKSLEHKVIVGSEVTVQKEGEKNTHVYTLVGSEEADTETGKISTKSPLGQAVLDKKKGEFFSFKTPAGVVKYKIINLK